MPFFEDSARWKGKAVYFLKRAQILVSDLKTLARLPIRHTDHLTAFPDYRVPQILRALNIIEYSSPLFKKITQQKFISSRSPEEIEIRSATIWGVEFLKRALQKREQDYSAIEVDMMLWAKTQNKKFSTPYHLTKTIWY